MKKLVALLVIVAFSASIYAQAQPQKKVVAPKAKTEIVKTTEKKAEPKAAEQKVAKKAVKKVAEPKTARKEVKKEVKK